MHTRVARTSLACALLGIAFACLLRQPPAAEASSSQRARGAETFATHGCAHCHGTDGVNGDRGPDLQLIRKRMSAAQVRVQIRDGSKDMPAFGDSLSTPQIDDLVAYLRAKRKHIVPPPPKPAADPAPANPDDNSASAQPLPHGNRQQAALER